MNPLFRPSFPCRVRCPPRLASRPAALSRGAIALGLWLSAWPSGGRAQTPDIVQPAVAVPSAVADPPAVAVSSVTADPPTVFEPPGPAAQMESPLGRGYSQALFVDVTVGFVPYANDVPLMLGAGIRFAEIHELWARVGFIIGVGDDRGYTFGSAGYRLALRPGRRVRPLLGGLVAGLGATCTHDALGQPSCTPTPLFIFAATGGVRIEPVPWLGLFTVLTFGTDTYPNPFGMLELGVSFALPQS